MVNPEHSENLNHMANQEHSENLNIVANQEHLGDNLHVTDGGLSDMIISPMIKKKSFYVEDIVDFAKHFTSPNFTKRMEACTKFKTLMSTGHVFHIRKAMQSGAGLCLLQFMEAKEDPVLQESSAAFIADLLLNSEAVGFFLEVDVVDKLYGLILTSACGGTQDQAIRALGNLAAFSPNCHMAVTEATLVLLLSVFLKMDSEYLPGLNNLMWTINVICHQSGMEKIENLDLATILSLVHIMLTKSQEEYIISSCDILHFLASQDHIQEIFEANIIEVLIKLSKLEDKRTVGSVKKSIFEILFLISTKANRAQIRTLVKEGLIECTDPFNTEVCIADLSITILNRILADGEIPDEVEQDQTSHVNPYLQSVKQLLGEGGLQNLLFVTETKAAYLQVLEILSKP